MSDRYKVGIIGCGGMGRRHMMGYQSVGRVDFTAVADPHQETREEFREEYGFARAYGDYEEMLRVEDLDLVSVCTWHLLHPAATIAAAEAGVKGIICEKPMAIGLGEADRMLSACEANGTRLVIGHQRRFSPGWGKARELIEAKSIGKPIMVTGKVREGLTNWATHTIDGIRYVLGDPEAEWVMGAVERRSDRHERDTVIEDCCMGLITFADGTQALIQSDLMTEGAGAGFFQIRGDDGIMEVIEGKVRLLSSGSDGWEEFRYCLEEEELSFPFTSEMFSAQLVELIEWIEGGSEHRGSGRKSRPTVEIMMAIYESARKNRVIRMPLTEIGYPLGLMVEEGKLEVESPGRYDIRGYLRRDQVDQDDYKRLRGKGLSHKEIMQRLGKA